MRSGRVCLLVPVSLSLSLSLSVSVLVTRLSASIGVYPCLCRLGNALPRESPALPALEGWELTSSCTKPVLTLALTDRFGPSAALLAASDVWQRVGNKTSKFFSKICNPSTTSILTTDELQERKSCWPVCCTRKWDLLC